MSKRGSMTELQFAERFRSYLDLLGQAADAGHWFAVTRMLGILFGLVMNHGPRESPRSRMAGNAVIESAMAEVQDWLGASGAAAIELEAPR